jgi:succinoglycan biosynthesis protein ExoA
MTAATVTGQCKQNGKGELPRLSVIVPCRNEQHFIAQCLDSILQNDYPIDRFEILVVHGMSTDKTLSIVSRYTAQHAFVKLLHNQKQITPCGLNLGIEAATGEIICRIDAHARIASDYLRRCVERLCTGDADNVGGAMRTLPANPTLAARAIALCMSHRFGAGNSVFRVGSQKPAFTDTLFGGCYRRQTFARIGLFNERLPRTQDIEFNQRLRKSGGKILLDPAIRCDYFSSPDLRSFCKHNFQDGVWSVLPFAYSDVTPVRWRHLVPLAFLAAIATFAMLGAWSRPCLLLLIAVAFLYAAISLAVSFQLSRAQRSPLLLAMMPLVFAIRHFAYGFGSLCGVIELFAKGSIFRALGHIACLTKSKRRANAVIGNS